MPNRSGRRGDRGKRFAVYRYNVYYVRRDPDGVWRNARGEAVELPISKATADAKCLVYGVPAAGGWYIFFDRESNETGPSLFLYHDRIGYATRPGGPALVP